MSFKYIDHINQASGQISDSVKMLVYKHDSELFDKIPFENDLAFTEPLIFAYFNSNSNVKPTLEQILWSYFKDQDKSGTFEITGDKSGIIYIPEYGYFIIDHKEDKLTCSFDKVLKLHKNEEEVIYVFEPIQKIRDTSISLFTHPSPLLDSFFRDSMGKQIQVELLRDEQHINNFKYY